MPKSEEDRFPCVHGDLLDVYRAACAAPEEMTPEDLMQRLSPVRGHVSQDAGAASLLTFETYLSMIALRLDAGDLRQRLSLVSDDRFDKELKRDPSCPRALMGAALSAYSRGDPRRGRRLLQRLAASGFVEKRLAQLLLSRQAAGDRL